MASSQAIEEESKGAEDASEWSVVGHGGRVGRHHPLYKKLATLNGDVERLSVAEVKARLRELQLSVKGVDRILYKRLKSHLRREAVQLDPTAPGELVSQTHQNPYAFDYLCVLDFEATCEQVNPPDYIHEIIEFPVLLLNIHTLEIEDTFHCYCKPVLNSKLSDFCKKLTGIKQEVVEGEKPFSIAFQDFTGWLESKGLGNTHRFALATDCPWDIKECLFPQCVLARVPFPSYAIKWIDVRKMFGSFYQIKSGNLATMLGHLGMKFEGREHCGLDDATNIARVAVQMVQDGCVLKYNRFMPTDVVAQFNAK